MSKNMYFSIICSDQEISFYQCEKEHSVLLGTYDSMALLIEEAQKHAISYVRVFDNTEKQNIKIEQCPKTVSIFDFFTWSSKKKFLALKQLAWGATRSSLRHKELLSVGTTSPLFGAELMQVFNEVPVDVFSYSMELGHRLRSFLKGKRRSLSRCLLVAVHQDYAMSTWYFEGERLLFWRPWPKHSQHMIESQIKSATLDTLRYLEKSSIDTGTLCFFMENNMTADGLSHAFPDALVFQAQDLVPYEGVLLESVFTQVLLGQKKGNHPIKKMHPKHYAVKEYGVQAVYAA